MSDCTRCGQEKTGSHSTWCRECYAEWRKGRRVSTDGMPTVDMKAVDTAGGAVDMSTRGGGRILATLEDEPSGNPYTAEEWGELRRRAGLKEGYDATVKQVVKWKGLPEGRGGRGWKVGHGPDSGQACCKVLVCYDARVPGEVVWQGVRGTDG